MALIATETLVKSAGDLYLAPYPEAAPTVANISDAGALGLAGWVHAGWLHEDGPSLDSFEGDNTKLYGWNAIAPIRSITRVTEPMVPVSLLQWNVENLSMYWPGATYDAPTQVLTVPESGTPPEQSLLLVVKDDAQHIGVWVSKVQARGSASLQFPGDGLSAIPITFDVLSTGDPASYVKVIGIDLAALSESSPST